MKTAVATEKGLALRDMPQPRVKPNEVLVKVRAAALNRADLATARGIPHGSHVGSVRRSASNGRARWWKPAPK